jgi:hypothetical protein
MEGNPIFSVLSGEFATEQTQDQKNRNTKTAQINKHSNMEVPS